MTRPAAEAVSLPECDEAIAFFTRSLGLGLREDSDPGGGKRRVRVAPPGAGTEFLPARAAGDRKLAAPGNRGGGRVYLFPETEDVDHGTGRRQARRTSRNSGRAASSPLRAPRRVCK